MSDLLELNHRSLISDNSILGQKLNLYVGGAEIFLKLFRHYISLKLPWDLNFLTVRSTK